MGRASVLQVPVFGLLAVAVGALVAGRSPVGQRWERDTSTPRPSEWARIVAQLEFDPGTEAASPDLPRLAAEFASLRLQIDGLQSEVRRLETRLELVGSAA